MLGLQIYVIVFLYGYNKYDLLINRQDTSHQSIINANEFKATDSFSLKEIEANFAFSLWSNQFVPTQFTTENIEDYIRFEVTLNHNTFADNKLNRNVSTLSLHPCNESDVFYKPPENAKEFTPFAISTSYCLDNIGDIDIWGNFDSTNAQVIIMRVLRCSKEERDTCKSREEIDQFMDDNGHLFITMNEQTYQSENYGGDTIDKRANSFWLELSRHTRSI